jgi:DNA modification methylase
MVASVVVLKGETQLNDQVAGSSREASPIPDVGAMLLPDGCVLLPGTSQIYELQLAVAETKALSRQELVERGAYFYSVGGDVTRHAQLCSASPVQVDKQASVRRRSFFEANLFKTGYATHGLFPYRGKFHPQMIKAVLNIIGVRPGETVLDPMMGSGTVCIEASMLGIESVGVDASPFCCMMTQAKLDGLSLGSEELARYASVVGRVLGHFQRSDRPPQARFLISSDDALVYGEDWGGVEFHSRAVERIMELCYLDTMGYAARRKTKTLEQLFEVVLGRYLAAIEAFAEVRDGLGLDIAGARIIEGDARELSQLAPDSVQGIVTSPPYSFAIDYVANDQSQLDYMGVSTEDLRQRMIGLRGRSEAERHAHYLTDMEAVMKECARVLCPGRFCVVVIGTNSNQIRRFVSSEAAEVGLDIELTELARASGLELVADVIHPIEGIRNMMRDEHLLFYRKL